MVAKLLGQLDPIHGDIGFRRAHHVDAQLSDVCFLCLVWEEEGPHLDDLEDLRQEEGRPGVDRLTCFQAIVVTINQCIYHTPNQ
jgi:hypothetical protein